jgi:hypothetical protein
MRVALHDADKTNFPNLALMKLSSWHKLLGDTVELFKADQQYDTVYSSKVFTFTPDDPLLPGDTIRGGTGYDIKTVLPDHIEACFPDYNLYNMDYSLGFLTRGCPRRCDWCFVPEKEGGIRPAADVTDFLAHDKVVLMDNNPLAHAHGIAQIEKMIEMGVWVDFNQGLDARLIDDSMARLLSKLKWLAPIRLACDSQAMIEPVRRAIEHLRWNNMVPSRYFCYVLVNDIDETLERLKFLKGMYVDPFAQPYLDKDGTPPTVDQKRLARWVNNRVYYKSMTWEVYREWRGDCI